MGDKLVIGPVNKGLRNDRTAFVIDNDSFPTMINAYQWRGRVKRKRGTSFLGRLTRYFDSTIISYNTGSPTITLAAITGAGNILTGFSLQTNGNIVPGSVTITVGLNVYTDPDEDGTLSPSGTINYATGAIAIPVEAGNNASVIFFYYPDLPVMGLRDLVLNNTGFPGTLGFDTVYSYNISTDFPYSIHDVSFYKNPSTGPVGYVPKTNETPVTWNGQDYQQFWTINYQGALWATNGINIPFDPTNIGMQFKPIVTVTVLTPTTASLNINAHGLVVGDFVFINEVVTTTGINFQTGYVTTVTDANNVIVTFPNATLATNGSGGIAQYLTSRSDITKDCIRFYDGDPTNGSVINPVLSGTHGWVNFCPPLSRSATTIADLPAAQYYLAGARMIVNYKDRLLFIGAVVQTSAAGSQVYLQDTVIYSQNGTPYYTASFTGDVSLITTNFIPILVPENQTATANAFFSDQTGFGGFLEAGINDQMISAEFNQDVLIIGFTGLQTRLVYTGNDILPFNLFIIDSELGSGSTFSTVNLGKGIVTRGPRGFILTSQVEARRIDVEIPDEVFQIKLQENGSERMTSQRDYINEWIYFTYPSNELSNDDYRFPTQTLQYNYRDDSWAIFKEVYTSYGIFRRQTGFTWSSVGFVYPTWSSWNDPWNAGTSTLLQEEVIAGNQQGYVISRDNGTNESKSLYIQSFSGNVVTSPDHCLSDGDYIVISSCTGTISAQVNGKTFSVYSATQNTFKLNPSIASGTYFGLGEIKRLSVPFIQTKQFPTSWADGRKTRIGSQQYLLTTTQKSQIQLLIYLSQNSSSPYNTGGIVPSLNTINDALIYSTVLYTCPESTNLGLTPSNVNLQMPTAVAQDQIWHRMNTSLLGDTVQIGFTISDTQMRQLDEFGQSFTITNASQAYPCVLTVDNQIPVGTLVKITGVTGMTQLNFVPSFNNVYLVLSSNSTSITINVDSSGFDAYISGGRVIGVANFNQTAEIELHGMILDVSPSSLLA